MESCSLLNGLSKSSIALFQTQIHKLFEENDCNLSSHMSSRHLLSIERMNEFLVMTHFNILAITK